MKWKKKTAGDQAKKKRKPAEAEEAPERQSPEEQVEELRERKPSNAEAAPEQQSPEQQSLEEQVEELRERNATLEDKLKRALADMANIRRRFGEDMRRREMEATMRIARELLPLMDSFRLARNAEADRESLLQGLGLVETMLEDLLGRHGIKRMDTQDAQFDPAYHDALAVEEREDIHEGAIVAVHQEGYLIHDRVLRAARVVVSRRPEPDGEGEGEKEEKSGDQPAEEEAPGNEAGDKEDQES